jgi:Mg-chelatase subunit ChlD
MSTKTSFTVSGIRRPAWVNSKVRQLVVLLRDASPSMEGEKVSEAHQATLDLVEELSRPENKGAFDLAIIDFHSQAIVCLPIRRVAAEQGAIPSLSVPSNASGTDVTAALREASTLTDAATQLPDPHLRTVVIMFSDGLHNGPEAPDVVATALKAKADLVTVAYGTDADAAMLRRIATSEQHAFAARTGGRALRAVLAAVGATLAESLSAGAPATQALARLSKTLAER